MKKRTLFSMGVVLFFLCGCERATVEKTAKPVIAPIKKTTDTVFKERKIGSKDTTQAVIFPRDQEQEHKQFKLKF